MTSLRPLFLLLLLSATAATAAPDSDAAVDSNSSSSDGSNSSSSSNSSALLAYDPVASEEEGEEEELNYDLGLQNEHDEDIPSYCFNSSMPNPDRAFLKVISNQAKFVNLFSERNLKPFSLSR